jgi:type VI secretion system secreted protein Hcp
MRTNKLNGMTIALAAMLTLGVGYVAYSGQLEPPHGPITPTGASLSDVFLGLNGPPAPPKAIDPGFVGFPGGVAQLFIMPDGGIPRGDLSPEPIAVFGFSHSIGTTRDHASGLPTGRRQHKPFTITKPIDKATPVLLRAMVHNDVIGVVEIRTGGILRGVSVPGQPVTYRLFNARVASVSPFTQGMSQDAVVYMEQVELVYDRISVASEDGGITAEDDWETPVAD